MGYLGSAYLCNLEKEISLLCLKGNYQLDMLRICRMRNKFSVFIKLVLISKLKMIKKLNNIPREYHSTLLRCLLFTKRSNLL